MYNNYFNEAAFQYAINILETDPYHAKERFEEYIKIYPKDYYARAYYAITLTRLGLFDEAEIEYEDIKLRSQNDTFYNTRYKNIKGFKYNMIVIEIKLLAHKKKYQEIIKLVEDNRNLFDFDDIRYILYYSKMRAGLFTEENIKNEGYRFMQSYNYSEELFREHIKKHLYEYNKDEEVPNQFVFSENFPVDKVIEEIKKYIPSDKKTCPGYFDNYYFFKYDNCGTVNNVKTNMFLVITYDDTKDFITMCPVIGYEKMDSVDLNYLIDYDTINSKIKKLSQIEKFNKRFNRV